MSINTPEDSVCDYLAELLYEGDLDDQAPAPEQSPELKPAEHKPAPKPALPQDRAAVDLPGREAPSEAPMPSVGVRAAARAESGFRSSPNPVSAPLPQRPEEPKGVPAAAALPVDRDKLTKLLNTARPKVAAEPLVTAEAVAPMQPPVDTAVDNAAATANTSMAVTAEAEQPDTEIAWLDNGRPAWAQERFDVLLFKVYGLTLAVPLIALGQIQPITEDLTPIFGQAKWLMGLQPTPMGQIKTVNTALFVMPERYNPEFLQTAKYVVSIDGLDWGLAVDSVQQPKSLDPDDVKWRSARGQRPWLAGTIKAHMCALIDVANMGRMLAGSDRNRKQ